MNAVNLKSATLRNMNFSLKTMVPLGFFYKHLFYWIPLNGCFWYNYVSIYSIILSWLGSEYVFWIYPKGEKKFLLNQIRFWRNTAIKLIRLCNWKRTFRKVVGLIIYNPWTPSKEFSWIFFDFLEQLCLGNFQTVSIELLIIISFSKYLIPFLFLSPH